MRSLNFTTGISGLPVILAAFALVSGCNSGSSDGVTVNGDVSIAYVKRPTSALGNPTDSVITATGGDLYMREKSSPSSPEINLTGSYTLGVGDVSDPEVSYDGTKILFAMRCAPTSAAACYNYQNAGNDSSWNIWEYDLQTKQMRRIIQNPAVARLGDDVDPAYLPNGDIVFTSTRQTTSSAPAGSVPGAVGYKYTDEYEREVVTVLHVMSNTGGNIKQISFNQSHDRNPTVLSTGEIMYARWDHVGNRNQFSIFKINPDGTDFFVLYGAHSPGNSYLHSREMPDGRVISSLMPLSGTREGGSLEIIDIQNYSENDEPATSPGPVNQLGSRSGQFQVSKMLLPSVSDSSHNAMRGMGVSTLGRYSTPYPLWDGTNRVLVTYSPSNPVTVNVPIRGQTQAEGTPRYGIWMLDLNRKTLNPVVTPQDGFLFSDPVALQARPVPGIKGNTPLDESSTGTGMGILNVKSVYDTDSLGRMGANVLATTGEAIPTTAGRADLGLMKSPANNATYQSRVARFFRITKGVATPSGLDRETIGESEFEMQQIIGYGVIEPDGSMTTRVPANTPVTITALDREGRGFTHHTNWLQVVPGETRTCNGCHSPRRGAAINSAGIAGVHPLATTGGNESMSETRFNNGQSVADLVRDLNYQDFWSPAYRSNPSYSTGVPVSDESPITISYAGLTTASPVRALNGATCDASNWSPVNCAIVINYETHIQPIWVAKCASCHSGGAPQGGLDLSNTGVSATFGRLNSYQELLVGDPVLVNGLPVITVDEDGDIRIQRQPALVVAGNSRSSRLVERISETELRATGSPCTGAGCTNHSGFLNAAEKRVVHEWIDVGAQYYNDPFDGSGAVRSSRQLLSETVFASTIQPILMANCASCHQPFGGNGTSSNPANASFTANRFVLTGSVDGDFNITASMVTDVCTPANSYLLSRPTRDLAGTPPHPGTGTGGSGPAVLPLGSANYNTILAWITAARSSPPCP